MGLVPTVGEGAVKDIVEPRLDDCDRADERRPDKNSPRSGINCLESAFRISRMISPVRLEMLTFDSVFVSKPASPGSSGDFEALSELSDPANPDISSSESPHV
jgi:hypothetical protein